MTLQAFLREHRFELPPGLHHRDITRLEVWRSATRKRDVGTIDVALTIRHTSYLLVRKHWVAEAVKRREPRATIAVWKASPDRFKS